MLVPRMLRFALIPNMIWQLYCIVDLNGLLMSLASRNEMIIDLDGNGSKVCRMENAMKQLSLKECLGLKIGHWSDGYVPWYSNYRENY
nr:hypothetical protein [Tanacetum cinerariifolium]